MGSNPLLLLVGHSHTQAQKAANPMDRLTVALVIATTQACASPFAPVSSRPPEDYRLWFAQVETCSGLSGDFDKIRWVVRPDVTVDGRSYYGYWYPDNTIVIRSDLTDYKQLIMHEEMHMLLRNGQHPTEYFDQKCGDLIDL